MEKFNRTVNTWQDRLDRHWKQLPQLQKRHVVMYSFGVYLLITLAIVLQVIYQVSDKQQTIDVEHIHNPLAKPKKAEAWEKESKDFKIQDNERK